MNGTFKGWVLGRKFGFIAPDDGSQDVFLHVSNMPASLTIESGDRVDFQVELTEKGPQANALNILKRTYSSIESEEEIEDTDRRHVEASVLVEISKWKREAKAEDNDRYFWHVQEVDQIARGDKYFVIGRKGSGKTAICEYLSRLSSHDIFSEKLSFKNFPFNKLYSFTNSQYTAPNQYITIWKYLIYSTVCRLMLRNEAIDFDLRDQLSRIYSDDRPLSRRLQKWVGKEFGVSLFGISVKVSKDPAPDTMTDWVEYVNVIEDLLTRYATDATYFVLFDELDEDYRDIIYADQHKQYTALITSLFKAVQDIRATFAFQGNIRVFPVIFLRDDIYEIVQDADKNKWGDFRVDLNWDLEKIKKLVAFRISRASNPTCVDILRFEDAWRKVFGERRLPVGSGNRAISTFEYIARSTLLRPRDFVAYLQNCAQHAVEYNVGISPQVVKVVDKAFSNYLRQELTDELFAILPDIASIFDAISQLRKWIFRISEIEDAYLGQVQRGFIKESNVKFVLQVLFMFSIIGNLTRQDRKVFRYQNREARLNFNERVVVHRGLFKALQIL